MINRKKITPEWLDEVSKKYKITDKIIAEKVIRALLLLEGLVKHSLSFIFKGGTALMLHFGSTKRLSIDIDIILEAKPENLEMLLQNVVSEQLFLRYELDTRNSSSNIEKAHYKFFYTPLYRTNKSEEAVLLDILFEQSHYANIISLPIESVFVPQEGEPLAVTTASLEDLLGDKLTAFAPNTTGIPYIKSGQSAALEIIKQLYDIGNLFDKATNLATIKTTFSLFARTEIAYRDPSLDENKVLDDIYQTALCLASRGIVGVGDFEALQRGITSIKSFIFSEVYQIEKAIVHASKAAYLATLIKQKAEIIEKYENPLLLRDWQIGEPLGKLNKLKKSNPEAFFYWYKTYKLVSP